MTEYLEALAAPFKPQEVLWRIGPKSGDNTKPLAYIDARIVMDRLDDVIGAHDWQCRYSHADRKTVCEIGLRVDGEWLWKADGAGESDIEGEKGALSDAFKRAAVRWGIGRYLYEIDAPWVKLTKGGKKILESEMPKLQRLLGTDPGDMPAIDVGRAGLPASDERSSPPQPEDKGADSSLDNLVVDPDADNTEFRNTMSGMCQGASDVEELESIMDANKRRMNAYRQHFPKDFDALVGEFKRRKGDLLQKPMEAA